MSLISRLINSLPDGEIKFICIGLHWTYVEVEVEGRRQIGLASTLEGAPDRRSPTVPEAGNLLTFGALGLAREIQTAKGPMASVAMATLNALLPRHPEQWVDINAEEVIARRGAGKTVALVGRFPFTDRLRPRVGLLKVIERYPQEGEFSPEDAPQVIPHADVVAITSMTFTNGSLEQLLTLCRPDSLVMLLGPTTPLSPILFDHGIDILAGAIVEEPKPVLRALQEGGNFRQLHRAGVRLVTITAA